MEKGIENLAEKVDDGFAAVNKKVDEFVAGADNKYAPKWIGTAFMAGCAVVLVGVITWAVIAPLSRAGSGQQTVTVTTQNPDGSSVTRVVPLSGSGQNITITPDSSSKAEPTPTVSPTPTQTPTTSNSSGICKVPVVGALCG